MPSKSCHGVTMFVRFTMLGDEVRRCDTCGQEYLTRPRKMKVGVYRYRGADPSLFRCGLLTAKGTS